MKGKLTIQINNLEALERLIGGDAEVEVDIRQNIVETFTKKHLKSLANDSTLQKIGEAIKKETNSEILEEVIEKTTYGGNRTSYKLSTKARELIREQLKYAVSTEIYDIIVEEIKRQNITDTLNATLERQVKYITEELTKESLAAKLDKMVEAKLKEKLGLK